MRGPVFNADSSAPCPGEECSRTPQQERSTNVRRPESSNGQVVLRQASATDLSRLGQRFWMSAVARPANEPTDIETAVNVRNSVLAAMVEEGYLRSRPTTPNPSCSSSRPTPRQGIPAATRRATSLSPTISKRWGTSTSWRRPAPRQKQLLGGDDAAADLVNEGGVRIYTTINPDWRRRRPAQRSMAVCPTLRATRTARR